MTHLPAIPLFFSSIAPSWVLNGLLILGLVGNFMLTEARFRTHINEREVVIQQEILKLQQDVTTLQAVTQVIQIGDARIEAQVTHIQEDVRRIIDKLDQALGQ